MSEIVRGRVVGWAIVVYLLSSFREVGALYLEAGEGARLFAVAVDFVGIAVVVVDLEAAIVVGPLTSTF